MTLLVVLTVVAIALLIAELAIYLFVVGSTIVSKNNQKFSGDVPGWALSS